jgi:hypothetical protein
VTKTANNILLLLGALVGLAAKLPMLFSMGVDDMNSYYTWGNDALELGLPNFYPGIYYPFQMQLFEAYAWIASNVDLSIITLFKLPNLLFDICSFILLVLLLKRQKANPAYALLYWLHPWFLTVFSLGYVDFQFSFFVLLCLWLLREHRTADYLLAGVPLAVAFLMKPQVQMLVVAVSCYGVLHYVRNRDLRPLGLLAAPVVLFLAYEVWFTVSGPRPWYAAAWILPESYLNVTNVMPALTAQMPNIWTPVAYLLKQPDQRIFTVSDQGHVLPFVPIKYAAACVVLGLVGLHVWKVEREPATFLSLKFAKIFLFAALAVPFLMTSAHENHLFLATVFFALFLAGTVSRPTQIAVHILLLVQFLNIYSLYEKHPAWLASLLHSAQSDAWQVVYSLISIVCFWLVAKALWSQRVERLPAVC